MHRQTAPPLGFGSAALLVVALASCASRSADSPPSESTAGRAGSGGSQAGSAGTGGGGASGQAGSGTGGSGGSSGAGAGGTSGQAGSGGNAGGAGGPALTLFDDFESSPAGGPPDAAKWSVFTETYGSGASVTIDGQVAHSGQRSLRVTGGGGYGDHAFATSSSAVAGGAVLFMRAWVRLGQALGAGHTTFLAFSETTENKHLRMGGQNQVLMWNRESDDATLPAMSPAGTAQSVSPPAQTWTCIELRIDGGTGEIETWVDGKSVPGLRQDNQPTPDIDQQWLVKQGYKPMLSVAKLGWESYAGQPNTVNYDDVAFSHERIGCN